MTETKFLTQGHIREYYDIRELPVSSHELIRRILKRIRECEKHNIDYDHYINDTELRCIIDILDCCLENKNNPNIKRRQYND